MLFQKIGPFTLLVIIVNFCQNFKKLFLKESYQDMLYKNDIVIT